MMNAILGVGGRPCRSSSFAPIYRCFTSFSSFQDSAPRPARVVVVGSGRMGQIRSSLLRSNPKFELVGIVDNVLSGAEKLASQYRVTPYETLDQVAEEESLPLDGIVCCSPTFTHEEILLQASEHRLDVFCEKPVDVSATKIERLFEIASEADINLCCGFQRRFDPSYQHALESVRSDKIGNPIAASIFFGDHPVPPKEFLLQGGGDIFMDLSAHDVDYILQALPDQEVTSVYATGTSSTPELEQAGVHDNATMVMNFSRGTVVTLFMSRSASYGYDQRCEIFGSKGMVQVGNIHETATVLSTSEGIQASKYEHSFPQRFHKAFGMELDTFGDVLLNDSVSWPVTKEDCIRVQRVADAAQESARTGKVIELEVYDSHTAHEEEMVMA